MMTVLILVGVLIAGIMTYAHLWHKSRETEAMRQFREAVEFMRRRK